MTSTTPSARLGNRIAARSRSHRLVALIAILVMAGLLAAGALALSARAASPVSTGYINLADGTADTTNSGAWGDVITLENPSGDPAVAWDGSATSADCVKGKVVWYITQPGHEDLPESNFVAYGEGNVQAAFLGAKTLNSGFATTGSLGFSAGISSVLSNGGTYSVGIGCYATGNDVAGGWAFNFFTKVTFTPGTGTWTAVPQQPLSAPTPVVTDANNGSSTAAAVGDTLSVDVGTWGPGTVDLSYQWLATDPATSIATAIPGATNSSYTVASAEAGQAISVQVTGTEDGFPDHTELSVPTLPVGTLATAVPTIDDAAPAVGQILTASPGAWAPSSANLAYQWYETDAGNNSTAIPGAEGSTFTVTGDQAGDQLSVQVTGTEAGYSTASETSALTAAVVSATLAETPVPTIDITDPAYGDTLTAAPGTWGPGTVNFAYQWYATDSSGSTTEISGATGAAFTVGAGQIGDQISVAVAGSEAGFGSVSETSALTAAVGLGKLTVPTISVTGTAASGAPVVGQQADQQYSGSSPTGTDVTVAYQWNTYDPASQSSSPISGATAQTFTAPPALVGDQLTVTVTWSEPNYNSASVTSAPSLAVLPGTLTAPTPTIDNTSPQPGDTLTATPGTWGPAPVTVSYQWNANGAPISGATSPTLTVSTAQDKQTITVTVTGSETGYTTVSKTSAATAAVGAAGPSPSASTSTPPPASTTSAPPEPPPAQVAVMTPSATHTTQPPAQQAPAPAPVSPAASSNSPTPSVAPLPIASASVSVSPATATAADASGGGGASAQRNVTAVPAADSSSVPYVLGAGVGIALLAVLLIWLTLSGRMTRVLSWLRLPKGENP